MRRVSSAARFSATFWLYARSAANFSSRGGGTKVLAGSWYCAAAVFSSAALRRAKNPAGETAYSVDF
jgi:hypothetical protein